MSGNKLWGYPVWEWIVGGALVLGAGIFFLTGDAKAVGPTAQQIEACKSALRTTANIPSTVSFDALGYSHDRQGAGGALRIRQDFSAKNAFGLELSYRAMCVFQGGSPVVTIVPRNS